MSKYLKSLAGLCLVLIIAGCATYNQHVADGFTAASVSNNPIEHQVFLVGDAGEEIPEQRRAMALLKKQVSEATTPTTVVFLGDNIYPVGMPSKKDSVERIVAEQALLRQVEAVADIADNVMFIPGNHDWKKGKSNEQTSDPYRHPKSGCEIQPPEEWRKCDLPATQSGIQGLLQCRGRLRCWFQKGGFRWHPGGRSTRSLR